MDKSLKLVVTTDKTVPLEPLHLVINTNGHKPKGKNLYKLQLRKIRRLFR